jgi:hypothetical protein
VPATARPLIPLFMPCGALAGHDVLCPYNSSVIYSCAGHYRIEVDSNKYKFFKDGSLMFVFNNNTFANGGVGLKSAGGVGGAVTSPLTILR